VETDLEITASISEAKLRARQDRYEVEAERLRGERREKEGYREEVERLRRGLEREGQRGEGRREMERGRVEGEREVAVKRLAQEDEMLESANFTLQESKVILANLTSALDT
jgi:hypothetical protein